MRSCEPWRAPWTIISTPATCPSVLAGEEFSLVLPDTFLEDERDCSDQIRHRVKEK